MFLFLVELVNEPADVVKLLLQTLLGVDLVVLLYGGLAVVMIETALLILLVPVVMMMMGLFLVRLFLVIVDISNLGGRGKNYYVCMYVVYIVTYCLYRVE